MKVKLLKISNIYKAPLRACPDLLGGFRDENPFWSGLRD